MAEPIEHQDRIIQLESRIAKLDRDCHALRMQLDEERERNRRLAEELGRARTELAEIRAREGG